jgi:hypothetical protein
MFWPRQNTLICADRSETQQIGSKYPSQLFHHVNIIPYHNHHVKYFLTYSIFCSMIQKNEGVELPVRIYREPLGQGTYQGTLSDYIGEHTMVYYDEQNQILTCIDNITGKRITMRHITGGYKVTIQRPNDTPIHITFDNIHNRRTYNENNE